MRAKEYFERWLPAYVLHRFPEMTIPLTNAGYDTRNLILKLCEIEAEIQADKEKSCSSL